MARRAEPGPMVSFRAAVVVVVALSGLGCGAAEPVREPSRLSLAEAMAPGDTEGFRRALEPVEIELPRDQGPHPGFQTEWWYLVGHLRAGERRFGYQITFFRSALEPPEDGAATSPAADTGRSPGSSAGRDGAGSAEVRRAGDVIGPGDSRVAGGGGAARAPGVDHRTSGSDEPSGSGAPVSAGRPSGGRPETSSATGVSLGGSRPRSGDPLSSKPREGGETSAWAARDVFMAHFAVTDVGAGRYHAFERFSRAALGLAGARLEPFRVWLEDWRLESLGEEAFPLRLVASQRGVAVDLVVEPEKPVVLQGERGLSRKGDRPGNASYYYSFTRLATRGRVEIGGEILEVEGSSWMDREWSTSALEENQVGWDWFALQLDDGRDLMAYRMRLEGDRTDPTSSGVVVEADGSYAPLSAGDFAIETLARWRSPRTGIEYPSAWRLRSERAAVDVTIEPLIPAQEHTGTVIYWEGAVEVEGTSRGGPVTGAGYVELTGYERSDGSDAAGAERPGRE